MLKILSKEEYKEYLSSFKSEAYHLTQSANWDDIQAVNFPEQVRFIYSNSNSEPLIIGRVVKSRILKFFNVLQLNYGPIIKIENIKQAEFNNFLKEIKEYFSKERIYGLQKNIFLQISPVSLVSDKNIKLSSLLKSSDVLQISSSTFRKLNSTIYVDLKDSIEQIQLNFRKDVRANLKKLQNENNVEVLINYTEEKEQEKIYFEEFWTNFTKSVEDKHFEDPGRNLYEKILNSNQGKIMLIKLNKEILSGAFLYEFKEQQSLIILSSFNTQKGLECKSPTYMRFEIIKWAKENGYIIVDFFDGGSTKGIREFKLGFTNNLIEYSKCYDLVINKYLYNLAIKKVYKY